MFMTPPKTIYRQQQPTCLGPLFQTSLANGLGHSAYSTLSLVTTHRDFSSYAHCFNWPVLLLTPLSPTVLFTIQTLSEHSRMAKLSQPYLRGHMRWNVTSQWVNPRPDRGVGAPPPWGFSQIAKNGGYAPPGFGVGEVGATPKLLSLDIKRWVTGLLA